MTAKFVYARDPRLGSAVLLPRRDYTGDAEDMVSETVTIKVKSGSLSIPQQFMLIRLIGVVDKARAKVSGGKFHAGDALYAWTNKA